jgi:Ran GTPase-activating protein (RanGAP) involved in mRNA processing and transport
MSWNFGGESMSGNTDSIRRAREIRKEGVVEDDNTTFEEWPEEEWEDEEWEDEDEEWEEPLSEKLKTLFKKALGPLVDFVIDVTTIATVPAALLLVATAYQTTTFDIVETALLLWSGTAMTLMIADAKQKLLQRLRLR